MASAGAAVPPRYWWLKRIALGCVLLMLAMVAAHLVWGWVARRRFDAAIARLRALGQPVLPEDFQRPVVENEANAAYFLERAGAALTGIRVETKPPFRPAQGDAGGEVESASEATTIPLTVEDVLDEPSLAVEYAAVCDEFVRANRPALDLMRRARGAPVCDWGIMPDEPGLTASLSIYSSLRNCAKTAAAAAIVAHHRGDDVAALDHILDGLATRREDAAPLLIGRLVGAATDSLICARLNYIAPNLRISTTATADGFVSRVAVEKLIQRLSRETEDSEPWRRAILGERAYQIDAMRRVWDGRKPVSAWWSLPPVGAPSTADSIYTITLAPRWRLQTVRMMDQLAAVAEWKTRSQSEEEAAREGLEQPVDPYRDALLIALEPLQNGGALRAFALDLGARAHKRLAATMLAIRLYELDHGRKPTKLSDLVPDYLPHVPIDPLCSQPRPLQYFPERDVPVLYSVGTDGEDDGGLDKSEGGYVYYLNREDRPRFPSTFRTNLSNVPDTTSPSSRDAVDDEPDEEEDGGGDGEG